MPGVDAKDVKVEMTAEDVVIKAAATHRRTLWTATCICRNSPPPISFARSTFPKRWIPARPRRNIETVY